jgi:hypothetical protein
MCHEIPFQLRKFVEKICVIIWRLENCMQSGVSVGSFVGEPTVNRLFKVVRLLCTWGET